MINYTDKVIFDIEPTESIFLEIIKTDQITEKQLVLVGKEPFQDIIVPSGKHAVLFLERFPNSKFKVYEYVDSTLILHSNNTETIKMVIYGNYGGFWINEDIMKDISKMKDPSFWAKYGLKKPNFYKFGFRSTSVIKYYPDYANYPDYTKAFEAYSKDQKEGHVVMYNHEREQTLNKFLCQHLNIKYTKELKEGTFYDYEFIFRKDRTDPDFVKAVENYKLKYQLKYPNKKDVNDYIAHASDSVTANDIKYDDYMSKLKLRYKDEYRIFEHYEEECEEYIDLTVVEVQKYKNWSIHEYDGAESINY